MVISNEVTSHTGVLDAGAMVDADGIDLEERLTTAQTLKSADDALSHLGTLLWKTAYAELAHLVKDFLKVDVAAMLLAGWHTYRELEEAGRRTLGTTERVTVDLAGRDLSFAQHPKVDVVLLEQTVTTIEFEVRTDIHVRVLVGSVRNGRLVSLTSGACDVVVTLSCQGTEIAKTAPRTFDPRVLISLGDGFSL